MCSTQLLACDYMLRLLFFSRIEVIIHVIESYVSMDYIADLKTYFLRLSDILDFQIVFMLFSAERAWAIMIFISLSVDTI